MTEPTRISMTPTLARQTQTREFGDVMKDTLSTAASVATSLLGGAGGGAGGIISTAVNQVSALAANPGAKASSYAASGVTGITGGSAAVGGSMAGDATGRTMATSNGNIGGMGDMISQMRAEADRSMAMQMQMQSESRDYNTLTNVLKVRHDSAKSAINNIR